MKKDLFLNKRGRKKVASLAIVSMIIVVFMACLYGCSQEDIDKSKEMADKIIDVVDKLDDVEKEIEEIIGEEAPSCMAEAGDVDDVSYRSYSCNPRNLPHIPRRPHFDDHRCPKVDKVSQVPNDPPSDPPVTGGVFTNSERPCTPFKVGVVQQGGVVTETIIIPVSQPYYPDVREQAPSCLFEDACKRGPVIYKKCNGGWYVGDGGSSSTSWFETWTNSLDDVPNWSGANTWYQG